MSMGTHKIDGNLTVTGTISQGEETLDTLLSNKADKTGYYGTMGSGYSDVAKELETSIGTEQETPFSFNTVGGKSDVSTGEHRLDALTGVSVVDNNITEPFGSNWQATSESISVSFSNGVATFTMPADSSSKWLGAQRNLNGRVRVNDILLCWVTKTSTTARTAGSIGITQSNVLASQSYTANSTATLFGLVQIASVGTYVNFLVAYPFSDTGATTADTATLKNIGCCNLTQRYGNNTVVNAIIGNDSSTQVKKLLQFDPSILKQTAYDAGTLVSSQSAKLKSVGYNQWDEEWEVGGLDLTTGQPVASSSYFRSKNFCRVEPSTVYYRKANENIRIFYYDANKNFISYLYGDKNNTFTTPANAYYFKLSPSTANSTYNHDICVFVYWDGSRTGYEPFKSETYQLPNIVQRGILKVDASGNVYADGDVAYPDGTGETRYGIVDLGTLNWYAQPQSGVTMMAATLSSKQHDSGTTVLCTKYEASNDIWSAGTLRDKLCATNYIGSSIYVYDSDYTDAATFKTAMSGVYLVYELATPTPITFTPFTPNVYGDDFGTFQALDEDGNEANLQGFSIFYRANIAGFTESVYARDDIDGDPAQLVSHTELSASVYTKAQADARFALKEALGGTLRQVLAVKASIEFSNTEYKALGDTTWVYVNERFVSPAGTVPNAINTSKNAVCTSYGLSPNWYNSGMPDKTVFFADDGRVVVHDSAYTDPTAFQNAMKGVLLAYEKA